MRAPRFPLELAVRYRPLGSSQWLYAKTGNVSASGVLVHEQAPPTVDTTIEFRMVLAGDAQAEVTGRGRVARVISHTERPDPGFAIAIEEYDFEAPHVVTH